MVITGPFDFFATFRSGDIDVESSGGRGEFAASLAACCARASAVQVRPVITADAPMTAFRMMNDLRLIPDGIAVSAGKPVATTCFLFVVFICIQSVESL